MSLPQVAPCDLELKINLFSAEADQPDTTLNIQKYQYIHKAVQDFMEVNEIHSALTSSLLELVREAIFSHMKSQVDSQIEKAFKPQPDKSEGISEDDDSNVSESHSILDIGTEALKFQESLVRFTSEYARTRDQDSFLVACNWLGKCVHSNILLQTLADLQFAYYQAVCDRTNNWNSQIQFMTQQQQDDITAARELGLDSENIQSRRLQIARDIDTLNKTRDAELEEMCHHQRREYRSWVVSLCGVYKEEQNQSLDQILLKSVQVLTKENSTISKELATISGFDQHNESSINASTTPSTPSIAVEEQADDRLASDPRVTEITSMGFEEPLARCALKMANDDLQQAILLLLDSPDQVRQHYQKSTKKANRSSQLNVPSSSSSNEFQGRSRNKSFNGSSSVKNQESPQNSKPGSKNNFLNMANSARNWLGKALDSLNNEDERNSLSIPLYQTDSFITVLGSHLRTPYSMTLTDEDPMSNDFASEVLSQTLKALHKPDLTARLVLFHPGYLKNYHLGRVANGWLFSKCSRLNELHFDPLGNQLSSIIDRVQSKDLTIQEGDFFITRHSNLSQTHLIIHMAVESGAVTLPDDLPQRPTLVSGMRSLLTTCIRYGIFKLVLPLDVDKSPQVLPQPTSLAQKLAASASKSNANSAPVSNYVRRHESMFKCIKGLLIESTRTGSLPYPAVAVPTPAIGLTFLLPPTDQLQFRRVQEQLHSVFRP